MNGATRVARPTLTLVVTSLDRPERLRRALRSATRQGRLDEIVVVDDGSARPPAGPDLPPGVRILRHGENRGVSAARNTGIEAARTSHVAFLDDDDVLMPWAARAWKAWLSRADDPDTIVVGGVLSGPPGRFPRGRRTPPTTPRGTIWGLDPAAPGRSFATKQAAALPVSLLRRVGGFDAALRSRVTSELFFRLSAEAPVRGSRLPVYWLNRGRHERITVDAALRERSAAYIRAKHADLLADPARREAFERNHSEMLARAGAGPTAD